MVALLLRCAYPCGCFHDNVATTVVLRRDGKEVPMRTIHVYRAARDYFVDGIYWGDDEEGVLLYLRAKGVLPEAITKALEQIAQEGTALIQQE
jgi:hypothetical protein